MQTILSELRYALKQLVKKSSKTVALLVQRDEARIYVPVHIG